MISTKTGLPIFNYSALPTCHMFMCKMPHTIYQNCPCALFPSQQLSRSASRHRHSNMLSLFTLFLLPLAARAALYAVEGGPRSWRDADWSSIGSLPPAAPNIPTRAC